ncbi:hypothetical protein EB151_14115, partial [archaeon]|nr:hypothetical protein [archaeon]
MPRKYRIIEEKYEHVSHFYPQYRDDNVAYYIVGTDESGQDIKSEYQYFGSWKNTGFGLSSKISNMRWEKEFYYGIEPARRRIEIDISSRETKDLKEI